VLDLKMSRKDFKPLAKTKKQIKSATVKIRAPMLNYNRVV